MMNRNRAPFAGALSDSNVAWHVSVSLADLELHVGSCVESNHNVDEVLGQSKLPQNQPQCGSVDGVERFHKVDEEGVGGEVVLLALAECEGRAEAAINGAALASEAGLLLEPLLLLDKVQMSHDYAREYLRCDVHKQIALQFLHCARSPFFGRSFMRATSHSRSS
jgi:hypothetical protein